MNLARTRQNVILSFVSLVAFHSAGSYVQTDTKAMPVCTRPVLICKASDQQASEGIRSSSGLRSTLVAEYLIIHAAWVSEELKAVWYTAVHDFIPTHDRLAKICLRASNLCNLCGRTDTIQHRLTECTDGADAWKRTRSQIATILRTDPANVRPEWTVRPSFQFWPHSAMGLYY